eukprot:5117336-Prymnesium_polylepis.2
MEGDVVVSVLGERPGVPRARGEARARVLEHVRLDQLVVPRRLDLVRVLEVDEQQPAWAQQCRHVLERELGAREADGRAVGVGVAAIEVVDHLVDHDDVEGAGGEGRRRLEDTARDDGDAAAEGLRLGVRTRAHAIIGLHAHHLAHAVESSQRAEEVARAAACVEHAQRVRAEPRAGRGDAGGNLLNACVDPEHI